jgi:hypothetical protein
VDPSLLCFSQQITQLFPAAFFTAPRNSSKTPCTKKPHQKLQRLQDRLQLPSITGLSQRRLSIHSFLHICTKRKKERKKKKAAPLHLTHAETLLNYFSHSLFLTTAGGGSTADSFPENNQRKQKLDNALT